MVKWRPLIGFIKMNLEIELDTQLQASAGLQIDDDIESSQVTSSLPPTSFPTERQFESMSDALNEVNRISRDNGLAVTGLVRSPIQHLCNSEVFIKCDRS